MTSVQALRVGTPVPGFTLPSLVALFLWASW